MSYRLLEGCASGDSRPGPEATVSVLAYLTAQRLGIRVAHAPGTTVVVSGISATLIACRPDDSSGVKLRLPWSYAFTFI